MKTRLKPSKKPPANALGALIVALAATVFAGLIPNTAFAGEENAPEKRRVLLFPGLFPETETGTAWERGSKMLPGLFPAQDKAPDSWRPAKPEKVVRSEPVAVKNGSNVLPGLFPPPPQTGPKWQQGSRMFPTLFPPKDEEPAVYSKPVPQAGEANIESGRSQGADGVPKAKNGSRMFPGLFPRS